MKRLLALILLLAVRCFATLPPATVWEVRPTVGSDTNGGGFVTGSSGTDWSIFNAAQYALTNGVTNGTTLIATVSASADMVGNIAYVTGGTGSVVAARYQIVSEILGVSITVDRSTGLTAGTGVTINIGGALATVATPAAAATGSNLIYVKATGSYTVTSALNITLQSSAAPANPFSIIGYTTTRGDNGQFTWTTATNSTDLITMNSAYNVLFENIAFTNTAGTRAVGIHGNGVTDNQIVYVVNCTFSGFTDGILGNFAVAAAFHPLYFIRSRITLSSSDGLANTGGTYIQGSMLDNNGGAGANWLAGNANNLPWTISDSIFYKNAVNGFTVTNGNTTTSAVIQNSDFSTNTGGGVLTNNSTTPTLIIQNCIFDANTTYGIDGGSGTETLQFELFNNAFFNNGSAAVRNIIGGIGTITLSASPYTTLGSNFNLNNTSGGGASLKGAGFPGAIPGGGTGLMSVGAMQPANASGGGSHGYPIVQ